MFSSSPAAAVGRVERDGRLDPDQLHAPLSCALVARRAGIADGVENDPVRTSGKVALFVSLIVLGGVAGYLYLVHALQPVPPAVACPGPVHDWRCRSYELIVSKPSLIIAGTLMGIWFAYAMVRLYAKPRRRSFTLREGLVVLPALVGVTAWIIALHPGFTWINWGVFRWDEVLLFFLAAVPVRLAIGIASIAGVRGSLILALSLPVICSGIGYAFITLLRSPPVGHSCPPGSSASACQYHPLIGQGVPWMILGLLIGLWLAYAVASDLAESRRRTLNRIEFAVVVPAVVAVTGWALIIGPQQAGRGDVGKFLLAVAVAATVRLLLAEKTVQAKVPKVLTKLGMVYGTEAVVER
jgi:hypothetical protein